MPRLPGLALVLVLAALLPASHGQVGFRSLPLRQWVTKDSATCVKLNCEVVGARPWAISYQVNGTGLRPGQRPGYTQLSDGSLRICNVDPDKHVGTYRCEVLQGGRFTAFKHISLSRSTLTSFFPPNGRAGPVASSVVVTTMQVRQVRRAGASCLMLTCSAVGFPRPLRYSFRFNQVPVAGENNVLYNCDLRNAAGVYNCTATNAVGRSHWRTATVRLTNPVVPTRRPVAPVAVTSFRMIRGECLLLWCRASPPTGVAYDVTLNGRGNGFQGRYVLLQPGVLRICRPDVQLDTGVALCTASIGGRRDTSRLSVLASDYTIATTPVVNPTPPTCDDSAIVATLQAQVQIAQRQLAAARGQSAEMQSQVSQAEAQNQGQPAESQLTAMQQRLLLLEGDYKRDQPSLDECRRLVVSVFDIVKPCN